MEINRNKPITIKHGVNIDPIVDNPSSEHLAAIVKRYCVDCVLEDVRKYIETTITENPREIIASITILSDKPVPTLRNNQ